MKSDIVRIPVRFNLSIPEHAEIVKVLRDLNRNYSTSMTGFIIEALGKYIESLPIDPSKPDKDYITRKDFEEALNERDLKLRLWAYEKLILQSQRSRESDPGGIPIDFDARSEKEDQQVDLSAYPEIMKDISSWSEG